MTILNFFTPDWIEMMYRFGINIFFNSLIIAIVFTLRKHKEHYLFTYYLVGTVIFFLCFTLKKFDLNLGLALGLFAVFGIIRYRTIAIKADEMTYLFVTIGISLINALFNDQMSLMEILTINVLIVLSVFISENFLLKTYRNDAVDGTTRNTAPELSKMSLLLPFDKDQNADTIERQIPDLEKKFRIKIHNYKVSRVDMTTLMFQVNLFYSELN